MAKKRGLFIDGRSVQTEEWSKVTNPHDGSVVGEAVVAGWKEADQAVRSALSAFEQNRKLSRTDRRRILLNIADGLRKHRRRLAELVVRETGKPLRFALGEVDRAVMTVSLAAEEVIRFGGEVVPIDIVPATAGYVSRVERFPVGPIIALSPFNFPINLTAHKIAPAIAVGSAVVLKPPP